MCRIGGRLRSEAARFRGATGEIPLWLGLGPNNGPLSGRWTVAGRQFDWGGRLLKCNGGAQRFPQAGWKSAIERKGIRELDCEAYKPSRYESRA